MIINLICFSEHGLKQAKKIETELKALGHSCCVSSGYGSGKVNLKKWTEDAFETADALIFVGAVGIAVRSVAPHIVSKMSDPAVIAFDDSGRFVIPILSGHVGGANELAVQLADRIGAISVITTATDNFGVFAIDTWAKSQGLMFSNPAKIKSISARLLMGDTITLRSQFPVSGTPPKGVEIADDKEYDVIITVRTRGRENVLKLIPPVCTVGLDIKEGSDENTVSAAVDALLRKGSISPLAVKKVASISLNQYEPGLLSYCKNHNLPFETYTADELKQVYGIHSYSNFNKIRNGINNVAERSAVLASEGGTLLTTKIFSDGIAAALAIKEPVLSF